MTDRRPHKVRRITRFGEPLWVDAIKTLGVALATLSVMFLIGAVLGLMVIAPWGRASPECSMWCVVQGHLEEMFSGT
jgi:hypothetical protein